MQIETETRGIKDIVMKDLVPQLEKTYERLKPDEPKLVWIGKHLKDISSRLDLDDARDVSINISFSIDDVEV